MKSHGQVDALESAWTSLAGTGWLSSRSPDVQRRLRDIAILVSCSVGETVYRHGDVPDGVYGLVSGSLDVLLPRMDGQEIVFHRAEPGFWIGDLALFAKQRRLVTLRVASPSLLVRLPQDRLAKLVAACPTLTTDFYELSHQNFATALKLLGNIALSGADMRVAMRLLMQRDALPAEEQWINVSQSALAELVALSGQSVRRSLRRLEDAGYIRTGYGRIQIVDAPGLIGFCDYVPRDSG